MIDHTAHTVAGHPRHHAHLLRDLPHDPHELSAAVGELLVHYRRSDVDLPKDGRSTVHARYVSELLACDQARHPRPLTAMRPLARRVQGCCRDFALLLVSALRERGTPARTLVGFADYFTEGWHHDHVVAEALLDGRWTRIDPEVPHLFPLDRGFATAAEVWLRHRREGLDLSRHGVAPDVPGCRGLAFVAAYVIHQVAHRHGDESLLWDVWGAMPPPDGPVPSAVVELVDELAELLVLADHDPSAAERLEARYRGDARVHMGTSVVRYSPFGEPAVRVELRR